MKFYKGLKRNERIRFIVIMALNLILVCIGIYLICTGYTTGLFAVLNLVAGLMFFCSSKELGEQRLKR